ncbi:MAG TPA: lytic murein transglycosylase [Solirubrobacterales bacterium]|nr:lytic murein transglycosylase [Solirubrobacterales bacterium]
MGGSSKGGGSGAALAAIPAACLLILIAFVMGIAIAAGGEGGCGEEAEAATGTLKGGVPKGLVPIYQGAAAKYQLGAKGPAMLASINFNETSFGTNTNNTTGSGAMGWMMFMPETWAMYGVDADGDGKKDPDDPDDAIYAAAWYLRASGAPGNWHDAIFAYNHAEWYVERIMGDFRRFQGDPSEWSAAAAVSAETCGPGGDAMLGHAQRLFQPKAFKMLPARLIAPGFSREAVDARIWADAVWLLETYNLRATAAREAGHKTHGDGTAMDLVPAAGRSWDETARKAAEDLGWVERCGEVGVAPVCPLVPAIEFIGYNGYGESHGDPAHGGNHLHVSWKSSDYGGCPLVTCGPDKWVMAFPLR